MRLFSAHTLLFVAVGCSSDKTVGVYNTPPSAAIRFPEADELFDPGEPVHFEGLVTDSQDEPDALVILWESSINGPLDDDASDTAGFVTFDYSLLMPGIHRISLSVTDTNGEIAVNSVDITVNDSVGQEGKPIVLIEGPIDGDVYLSSEPVNLLAMATDLETDWELLDISVYSSRDGLLWQGNPLDDGRISQELLGLSIGAHTLTVSALDEHDNQDTEAVSIEILEDVRPMVAITYPADLDWFWMSDTIIFTGEVGDDQDNPTELLVNWSSDLDGDLGGLGASLDGSVTTSVVLTAGIHTITLDAVDSEENTSNDQVVIEVRDPLAHDGDMDGYTELDGDCDDADPYTHPAGIEVCDDADNNCDGRINEDDWDDWEPNDGYGTAIDAGEIDSFATSASWSVAALTLHTSSDEDWVRFDVDDDLFEALNIMVEVMTLPSAGNYVVELYWTDWSTTTPVDSDSGSGRLTVGYVGDTFDSDEDHWAIRVRAATWPSGSCSHTYGISITR